MNHKLDFYLRFHDLCFALIWPSVEAWLGDQCQVTNNRAAVYSDWGHVPLCEREQFTVIHRETSFLSLAKLSWEYVNTRWQSCLADTIATAKVRSINCWRWKVMIRILVMRLTEPDYLIFCKFSDAITDRWGSFETTTLMLSLHDCLSFFTTATAKLSLKFCLKWQTFALLSKTYPLQRQHLATRITIYDSYRL